MPARETKAIKPKSADTPEEDIEGQRKCLFAGIAVAGPVTIVLWLAIDLLMPPLPGMTEPAARLGFALGCCCLAVLFCLVSGIEAVSHERLGSPAINPLSGYETQRMKINQRYLQQTLEQLLMFIPGLFALAFYASDGRAMRAVVATTAVWILSRAAFWISYHFGPQHRTIGLTGMVQSMLVLFYACGRFGYQWAGVAGAIVPIALFLVLEAFLVWATRPLPSR